MRLATNATVSAPAVLAGSGRGVRSFPVRHGIIESGSRRILVDAGYGPRVVTGRRSLALTLYAAALRVRTLPFTEGRFDAVLLTHLHADHVGRSRDLGNIPVFASRAAVTAFQRASSARAASMGMFAELLPFDLARRFQAVEDLSKIGTGTLLGAGYDLCGDGTHLAVPLPGHAPGHLGVFWREEGRPILYATDAAWTMAALRAGTTPRVSRRLVFSDPEAGLRTEAMVLAFERSGGRVLLCHDPDQP